MAKLVQVRVDGRLDPHDGDGVARLGRRQHDHVAVERLAHAGLARRDAAPAREEIRRHHCVAPQARARRRVESRGIQRARATLVVEGIHHDEVESCLRLGDECMGLAFHDAKMRGLLRQPA